MLNRPEENKTNASPCHPRAKMLAEIESGHDKIIAYKREIERNKEIQSIKEKLFNSHNTAELIKLAYAYNKIIDQIKESLGIKDWAYERPSFYPSL